MNNIGDFIKELRLKKRMTQKALGEVLDIDDKTISKWERGVYLPDITMLIPLSKALDITVDELLDGKYHLEPPVEPNIIPKEEPIKPEPITIPKYRYIKKLVLFLIILIFFLTSIYLTTIKSFKSNEEDDNVNIYRISSTDENLLIDGYIIENKTKYVTLIKYLRLKPPNNSNQDLQKYKIEIDINDENKSLIKSNSSLKDGSSILKNSLLKNELYELENIESQVVYFNSKINLANLTLGINFYDGDEIEINQKYSINIVEI